MGNVPDEHDIDASPAWPEIVRKIRERTPARIFVKRGSSYGTKMQLELRGARANAVDAVWSEFDMAKDFPADFVRSSGLFQVSSQAETKSQFLLRPDLGRKLSDAGRELVLQRCVKAPDLQIVIGDGLSGAAVSEQVPVLLPLLQQHARAQGWSIGSCFLVRHCRVGIINDVGDLLSPQTMLLLIGERPGLATAASLSAYMAFRPHSGNTDADRNVISNIHPRGIDVADAAARITNLAEQMMRQKRSGTALKGDTPQLPRKLDFV
jgi:ethanolamine ammonia-lyase small subunit